MTKAEQIQIVQKYVGTMLSGYADWDYLIEWRGIVMNDYAAMLNVKQDYLTFNTDFWKGIQMNNMNICIKALVDAINRINELKL